VQKANADLIRALADPETRRRLARLGREERPMSPAETLTFIQREQQKWAPIQEQIAGTR
jgi:tripartite-type tricarboxylate transporter receptor subunit TctC